jgi:hypothetical protein
MSYQLIQLASGSYDIVLDDRIIGSAVRGGTRNTPVWIAELLEDSPLGQRPAPFTMVEHAFGSFEDLCVWLGSPQVKSIRHDQVVL